MILLLLISIAMNQAQDDIYQNLIDWLGNDNDVSKIIIKELSPGQRIILANQDLKAGEEFVRIDNSYVISQQFVRKESLINQEIISKLLQIDRNMIYTIMFMLEESTNPLSSWIPYLQTLPQYFDDFPQLYQEDYLDLLKGHSAYKYVEEDKNEWTQEYNLLQNNSEIFRAGNYSYDEYVYWRLVLMSRAFNIGGDALIPYVDMLNDHPNGFVRGYVTDSYFGMKVTKDVKKGEEILFKYINEGNEYYLLHYGYVSEDNYMNTFEYAQCLTRGDPLYIAKQRMYDDYDCLAILLVNSTVFQEDILSAARLSAAQSHEDLLEMQLQQQSSAFDAQKVQFISIQNEVQAITNLIKLLQDTISKLPTTIEQDQSVIDDPNSHYVRKYIAIYTKLQKLVVELTINDLSYILNIINDSAHDLNNKANSLQYQRIEDYYTRVIASHVIHEDL